MPTDQKFMHQNRIVLHAGTSDIAMVTQKAASLRCFRDVDYSMTYIILFTIGVDFLPLLFAAKISIIFSPSFNRIV